MNTSLNRTQVGILTNKSGGAVAQGDVIILDSANASSFTTTTTAGFVNGLAGVVLDPNGIANNAAGMVALGGYAPKINLSGTGSIGDLVKTHTVAKQGARHAAPMAGGDFAQVLETSATPAAWLFGFVSQAGGGAGSDTSAIHDNESGEISALTEKVTPHNDDLFIIEDSEASNAKKKVKKSSLASGSGINWTQAINEGGTSFANFTAVSGTWSSDGTVIKQTDASANNRFARYNTLISMPFLVYEAEIQLRSSGAGRSGGLALGFDGTAGSGISVVFIDEGANAAKVEVTLVESLITITATINVNTWYKLRAVTSGGFVSVYLDGTLLGSTGKSISRMSNSSYIGLFTYQSEVWFRNIKAWNLDLPA
jgi:hypothetical protein